MVAYESGSVLSIAVRRTQHSLQREKEEDGRGYEAHLLLFLFSPLPPLPSFTSVRGELRAWTEEGEEESLPLPWSPPLGLACSDRRQSATEGATDTDNDDDVAGDIAEEKDGVPEIN